MDSKLTSSSKFTHKNDGFVCEACGQTVLPRRSSCRNHCPHCLVSKHVDIFPGDRAHDCKGLMDCIGYEKHSGKGLVLIFKCRKCHQEIRNIAAHEDPIQADNYSEILKSSLRS